jgi:hypothetical protein
MRLVSAFVPLAAFLLASCGTAPGCALIVTPFGVTSGGKLPDVPGGATRLVSSAGQVAFCLDRAGTATVDRVVPHVVAGALRVDGFAIVTGAAPGTTLAAGAVVSHRCPGSGRGATDAELASMAFLQLRIHQLSAVSTVVDSFVLEYTSAGQRQSFTFPWRLEVCAPGDKLCG